MKDSEEHFIIQGFNGREWVELDRPVKKGANPLSHRDLVVKGLRECGIKRYTQVRVVRVTTLKVVHGGTVKV